ncbi:hypothetical protein C8Q80DRAFT_802445 [Daedaleopsis nitida]|nr:hypothetical protein C8Q80DRAFT_802445 [Daedaleopsis nitida]
MYALHASEYSQPQRQHVPSQFPTLPFVDSLDHIPYRTQYLDPESTGHPAALEWYCNELTPDPRWSHASSVWQQRQRFLPGSSFAHGSMSDDTYLYPPLIESSSSSNTPSPVSPRYVIDNISNGSYIMDQYPQFPYNYNMGGFIDAKPTPPSGRCQWGNCDVVLDDQSHSGLRRHFREFHNNPRGTQTRCIWGQGCRSETMLFENIPKHIAECHLKTMKEHCPGCGNSFARKDTLKRHLSSGGCPAAAAGQA